MKITQLIGVGMIVSIISYSSSISYAESTNPFADVTDDNPNKTAIVYLYDNEIISGYDDGTFKPQNDVNRAEMLKILVGGTNVVPTVENYHDCFTDVSEEWFAPYVCYAKEQGWVQGYSDGTFKPEQAVNKAEAVKMLVNSQGYEISVSLSVFDFENPQWYNPFVAAASDRDLLEESQNDFNNSAGDYMTRGSMSESIYRAVVIGRAGYSSYTAWASAQQDIQNEDQEFSSSDTYITESESDNLFPINLRDNTRWEIYLSFGDSQSYDYRLRRTEGSMDVELEGISTDPATNITTFSGDGAYYFRGEDLVMTTPETCRYESLHLGCSSEMFTIPGQIDSSSISETKFYYYYFEYAGDSDSYGTTTYIPIQVRIAGKNRTEKVCNVRGVDHNPYDVYYTKDSEEFDSVGLSYVCFETEAEAKEAGYKEAEDN